MFGNPGSTELPMLHAFPDDFTYVLGLQEAVVVGMAEIARGYGVESSRVAGLNELRDALFEATASDRPELIEVAVAPGMALSSSAACGHHQRSSDGGLVTSLASA